MASESDREALVRAFEPRGDAITGWLMAERLWLIKPKPCARATCTAEAPRCSCGLEPPLLLLSGPGCGEA